jgi:hypothetical protein
MNWDQIAKRWRGHLVDRLQDVYGLPEKEARKKAEVWLGWLKEQSGLELSAVAAGGAHAQTGPLRPRSRVPAAKSRSRSAASL